MEVTLNSANYDEEVKNGKVLVDFWASWCGPCMMLAPIVEEISKEMPELKVCKVNTDENPELCRRFGIMSIPTLFLYENGELKKESAGYMPKDSLRQWIKE